MPDWKALTRTSLAGSREQSASGSLLDDVIEEVAQHADEMYRSAIAAGRSAEESRAAVEAELHNLARVAREARRKQRRRLPPAPEPARGRPRVLSAFARDVLHGARLLAARPGFTAIAVLTLALGIGANTAIFSVVYSLFLAPLPFPDPDRLVMVWENEIDAPQNTFIMSAPNWADVRAQNRSFERMALWEHQVYNVAGGPEPEQVPGMRVTADLFPMLGVRPQFGRTFTEEEEAPGHRVAVISDALWRRRFGGRADVVGQTLRINGEPFEVIGVMPPEFRFIQQRHGVWIPIALGERDTNSRDSHSFFAAARLKRDVSFEAAKADVEQIGNRLQEQYEADRGDGATITRMRDHGVSYLAPTLRVLLGAVALVLLIACVNVANLLLARSTARQREFTVRTALGAGRARLASQLLAEGLLLALIGAAAGWLLAWIGTAALSQSMPPGISRPPFREAGGIPLNAPVLLFTCGIAILTGILFSLMPMLAIRRVDAGEALKSLGDRGATTRFSTLRVALAGLEVALAVVVLSAAGLMIKSVQRLIAVDSGLNARHVLLLDMALPQPNTYGPPRRTTFCDDVQRDVGSLPGVVTVGAMSHMPFEGNAGRGFVIEGRPAPKPNEGLGANYRLACPGYFATLGIPLVRGRDFTRADTTTSPAVVIINEQTARQYWPGGDPLGQRIKLGGLDSTSPWMTIVGMARDVKHFGLDSDARREIYRPYTQAVWPSMTITVKTAMEPLLLAPAVRAALARIDAEQPVSRVRSMEQVVSDSIGGRRFPMQLLGLFSGVALALAAIGVYGVVSCIVSLRTREIGIRTALGARRGQVIRLIVGRSLVPIAAGLCAGVIGALFASRLLRTLLYDVMPSDPIVLVTIVVLLGSAAVAASWLPARRASRMDPIAVLREE